MQQRKAPDLQERLQLSAHHGISTLLLLQIIHELVHSSSVVEMVIDAMNRRLRWIPDQCAALLK